MGLAVSEDGRWAASASWDHTARIWDLAKREAGPVLEGHTGPVNAVAFSADGARIYTASADGSIGLWSRQEGAFQRPLHRHGWGINVLARMPGGEHLVFGALNGSVAIVDGDKGDVVKELPAHERPVLALAVLDKPGIIATGGGDGVIRVLRYPDGSQIEEYRNSYGPVWALAFAAEGTALYYGGLDDFATLWRITHIRLAAPDRIAPDFEEDMHAASGGLADRGYFQTLADNAVQTVGWLQAHGVEFVTPIYYLSAGPARIQPVGGGSAIVEELLAAATRAGVKVRYEHEAKGLVMAEGGGVSAIAVRSADGDNHARR